MEIKLLSEEDKLRYKSDIIEILEGADKEFVPPLSSRVSTSDTDLSGGACNKNGCFSYYLDMIGGEILGAFSEKGLIGFVAFRKNVERPYIGRETFPNVYISTLVVSPFARGMGLTKKMYSRLIFEICPEASFFTRTWSENGAHLKILSDFGFTLHKRIPNDRGEGIDTVYLCLQAKKPAAV